MKMKISIIIYFLLALTISFGQSKKSVDTKASASTPLNDRTFNDLLLFKPLSFITLIETGNQGQVNDSLSTASSNLLSNVLKSFPEIPLSGDIKDVSDRLRGQIAKETEYLLLSAQNRKKGSPPIQITQTIDSLLEAGNNRYGMITASIGFTRQKGNMGKQVSKAVLSGILTLGLYAPVPIKANSTIYAAIVDAKENRIVFYKKTYVYDKEPLNEKVIRNQVIKLYKDYFL